MPLRSSMTLLVLGHDKKKHTVRSPSSLITPTRPRFTPPSYRPERNGQGRPMFEKFALIRVIRVNPLPAFVPWLLCCSKISARLRVLRPSALIA